MRPAALAPALAALVLSAACRKDAPVAHRPAPVAQRTDPSQRFVDAWRASRDGHADEALGLLEALDRDGWDLPVDPGDFPALAGRPELAALVARVAARAPRTALSEIAVTLPEQGLIPEGIAADPRDGTIYVGSIARRKIVRVSPAGEARDFVPEGTPGLGEVLGLEVDVRRGILWAASNARKGEPPRSALHAFDLATGAERRAAAIAAAGHLLNDVAVGDDGTVFVTDSDAGLVHRLAPGASALVALPASFREPNGIALVDGRLVVADSRGLTALDVTGAATPLVAPTFFPLGGIDGLSARGRTLVAIQNALGTARILRIDLSPGATAVVRADVVEAGNPLWSIPTTGDLLGEAFLYVGNSHLEAHGGSEVAPPGRVATRIHRLRPFP